MHKIFFLFVFLMAITLFGQEEEDVPSWFLGLGGEVYIPSSLQSDFYAGYPENVNNLNYVLSNSYWYAEIKTLFDEHVQRDSFQLVEYPTVRYGVGFAPSFTVQYRWNDDFYISVHSLVAKLKPQGMATFEVYPPFPGDVHSYVYLPVEGVERRSVFSFNFTYFFPSKTSFRWFSELGAMLTSVRVLSHMLYVFDRPYTLQDVYGVPYVPNAGLMAMNIHQGGTSVGIDASVGLRWKPSRNYAVDLFYRGMISSINLEGYNRVGFQQSAGVKIFASFVVK